MVRQGKRRADHPITPDSTVRIPGRHTKQMADELGGWDALALYEAQEAAQFTADSAHNDFGWDSTHLLHHPELVHIMISDLEQQLPPKTRWWQRKPNGAMRELEIQIELLRQAVAMIEAAHRQGVVPEP